jgi:hypothetical protein
VAAGAALHARLRRMRSDPLAQYTAALMQGDVVKRLVWTGLQAGLAALAGVVVQRVAVEVWRRVFDEEPPE